MIKAVGNKRLNLTEEEFRNYESLISFIDKSEFVGLFETDNNGFITSISIDTAHNISMGTIMFLNQVMFNQRFRIFLEEINKNREKINELSKKIAIIESNQSKENYNDNA